MDINEPELLRENIDRLKNLTKQDVDDILFAKKKFSNPIKEDSLEKLIDCAHEIVFSINANVLMQNEKGEHVGTREICVKNYHIPVPIDKDYNNYMSVFFEYLEKKIIESIADTNKTAKDKEDNEK